MKRSASGTRKITDLFAKSSKPRSGETSGGGGAAGTSASVRPSGNLDQETVAQPSVGRFAVPAVPPTQAVSTTAPDRSPGPAPLATPALLVEQEPTDLLAEQEDPDLVVALDDDHVDTEILDTDEEGLPVEREVVDVEPPVERDSGNQLFQVASIEEILLKRNEWLAPGMRRQSSDTSLSSDAGVSPVTVGKRSKKRTDLNPTWRTKYPWIQEVKEITPNGKEVTLGLLCKVCREAVAGVPYTAVEKSFKTSGGGFINRPFVTWSHGSQKLFHHEFGDHASNKEHPLQKAHSDVGALRKKYLDGSTTAEAMTPHMKYFLTQVRKQQYEKAGMEVSSQLQRIDKRNACKNREAVGVLLKLCLKLVQDRAPLRYRFAAEVDFLLSVNCADLAGWKRSAYTSQRTVAEYVHALYVVTIYGIYREMVSTVRGEEDISFGVLVDVASTSKVRQWLAVCVQYVCVEKSCVVERVISVLRVSKKDGKGIMDGIQLALAHFNDAIISLHESCQSLFDGQPKLLDLANCSSYASDGGGGARSARVSANCRIKKFNPRNTDFWCGSHRGYLVIKGVLKRSTYLKKMHDTTALLHSLLTSSAEVNSQFQEAQRALKETETVLMLGDRAMFKWTSEKDVLDKFGRLHLSIEAALAQLKSDTRDATSFRYSSNKLYKDACTPEYILYVGFQRDLLAILVRFISLTEIPGKDLTHYDFATASCIGQLEALRQPFTGRHYKEARTATLTAEGKYGRFISDRTEEEREAIGSSMERRRLEAVEAFVDEMKKYHLDTNSPSILSAYGFFSLESFSIDVACALDLDDYASAECSALEEWFCQEVEYTAKWPEDLDQKFTAPSIGSRSQLSEELILFKKFVFDHFLNKINPVTRQRWRTDQYLLKMLSIEPAFLGEGSVLRRVVLSYLELPLSTSAVECVFSAVKLVDSPLCRQRKDSTIEKLIVLNKESSNWRKYDLSLATTIWFKRVGLDVSKQRNIAIASAPMVVAEDYEIVRTMAEKAQGRKEKATRRERREQGQHQQLATTEQLAMDDAVDDYFRLDDDSDFEGFDGYEAGTTAGTVASEEPSTSGQSVTTALLEDA